MFKSKLTLAASIPLLLIAIVLLFPLKDGATVPAAARNAVLFDKTAVQYIVADTIERQFGFCES